MLTVGAPHRRLKLREVVPTYLRDPLLCPIPW